jgi:hypothetical protein
VIASPCQSKALRQALRTVRRLSDNELRAVGLRTTQYSLLRYFHNRFWLRGGMMGGKSWLFATE